MQVEGRFIARQAKLSAEPEMPGMAGDLSRPMLHVLNGTWLL